MTDTSVIVSKDTKEYKGETEASSYEFMSFNWLLLLVQEMTLFYSLLCKYQLLVVHLTKTALIFEKISIRSSLPKEHGFP